MKSSRKSAGNPPPIPLRSVKDPRMIFARLYLGKDHHPAYISRVELAVSAVLSLLMISALSICFKNRAQAIRNWTQARCATWTILAIYLASIAFILGTSILMFGQGVNSSIETCSSAILLCLLCYMSIKLFIYLYLVEKVYLTRNLQESRLKSKLYFFNCFGILLPYCLIAVVSFLYRHFSFTVDGTCIIGIQSRPLIAFIVLDAAMNLYLTLLFVVPLRNIYTHCQARNSLLRTIAIRSLLSCLLTTLTSTTNLTALLVLDGEPAWIFLLCCNMDVVFSVMVRRWVTLKSPSSTTHSGSPQDVVVDESNIAPTSFASSQTAQNSKIFINIPELGVDENWKISEIKMETPSSSMQVKQIDSPSTSVHLTISPKYLQNAHHQTSQSLFPNSNPDTSKVEYKEDTGRTERAIITTHISAQNMHYPDLKEEFNTPHGEELDNDEKGKLGGIRVVVEQVFEVEIDVTSRERTSVTA